MGGEEDVKVQQPNKVAQGFKDFGRFLYNSDDKTVFGRGGKSWAKISLFYLIFYSCLAGFFAINMQVMMMTIDEDVPTITGRSNRPTVGINQKDLYIMDFNDKDVWGKYKTAINAVKDEYDNVTATATGDKVFTWSDISGDCGDPAWSVQTANRGCFYVGVNRAYGFNPTGNDTTRTGGRLFINCDYDIGIAGDGDTETNTAQFTVIENPATQDLSEYYPWTSKAVNGLQPLVAVKVEINDANNNARDDKFWGTFLKCQLYTQITGEEAVSFEAEGGQFARLTIVYPEKNTK